MHFGTGDVRCTFLSAKRRRDAAYRF